MVGREPEDLGPGLALGDVVFLVAGDGSDVETLGVGDGRVAVAVNDVVGRPLVSAVEDADIDQVGPEEGLVADLGDLVEALLVDGDDLGHVGALADQGDAVFALEIHADEAGGEVGIELGVVVDHLGDGDRLEGSDFRLAREVLAVFLLDALEPVDGVFRKVIQLVLDVPHLTLDREDLLVDGFGVELGNLADRFFNQLEDVLAHDFAAEEVLVLLHPGENLVDLGVPVALVLFQHLVDPVLEEDALQGVVVPFSFQFVQFDAQLFTQQLHRMEGVVAQDLLDVEELGLVVLDDAGVGGDAGLAVREREKRVDGLVGRDVVGQVDDDFDLGCRHVLDLLDLDLALILGFQDGIDDDLGGLAVGDLRDGDGVLVALLDLGADLDHAAAAPFLVLRAVGVTAGGEVRIELDLLAFQDVDGGVEQLVEVVRQDLRRHADCDAFCALREQERETHRELDRLLVATVVGRHPVRDLGVEDDFLGELAQARLDVTRGGVAVAGEDVTPVSLAVDGETFLSQLHEGAQDGRVSVRMVLHRLSDDVGDLGVVAVVHLVHRMQHAALDRLQAVHDVRDRTLQDDVGGIVQEPVLEHARQLVLMRVASQQTGEFAGGFTLVDFLLVVELFVVDHDIVFFHNSSLFFVSEAPELFAALAPVRVHLDIQAQENLLLEEVLHFEPCLRSEALHRRARLADQDALLAVPHHVDDGADLIALGPFLEGLDLHFAAIGNLLPIVEQDLLPDDFRSEESQVAVCEGILVVPRRADRKPLHDRVEDAVQIEALLRRGRDDQGLGQLLLPPGHQLQHLGLVADVYLVDDQDDGTGKSPEFLDVFPVLVRFLDRIRHIQDDVCIPDGSVHEIHHVLLEPVIGLQDARGVGIHDLEILSVDDAHDAVARRLGLGRDDAELLAHEGVHQRGLADVRVPYDVDESGAMLLRHRRPSSGC